MPKIISFNAFLRGTGKSNLAANVATLLAQGGRRVGVVDLDESAPTLHLIFGLPASDVSSTLGDFLAGRCPVQETAYEVTPQQLRRSGGGIFLAPLSIEPGWMPNALRRGLDTELLSSGLRDLADVLALDFLIVDSNSGINELSLTLLAMSDVAAVVLRLDKHDYQGTAVIVELARKLEVPRLALVVNMIPASFDAAAVQAKVAETYGCEVAAALPYSNRMAVRGGPGLFVLAHPDHSLTAALRDMVNLTGIGSSVNTTGTLQAAQRNGM
jgi:septum site-determining protein MinD